MKSPARLVLGLVAIAMLGSVATEATAQIFGRRLRQESSCPGGVCPAPATNRVVYEPAYRVVTAPTVPVAFIAPPTPVVAEQSLPLPEGVTQVASAVADGPHCRCLVNGSCGSGTICGADASGAYVVSNAHVWGTQIGKSVTVDLVSGGATKRMAGRIVFSGYSSSRMVDFSIAKVEGLKSAKYMPMLKTEPTDAPYGTRGSPKCVWPQVTKPFNDARNYGQGLITGTPDAIGGQSGSAIYNSKGQQIALLTWSINGRCAGQKTSLLWQVATQRNVMLADARPSDLMELRDGNERPETEEGIHGDFGPVIASQRPITEDGIHGDMPVDPAQVVKADLYAHVFEKRADDAQSLVGRQIRPITENVIASQASMQDLPIWFDANQPPVDPPTDPDADCYKLTAKEWELIQFLRKQSEQQGEVADRDWLALFMKLMPIIMELIKAISDSK